jgi:hypothetical protein
MRQYWVESWRERYSKIEVSRQIQHRVADPSTNICVAATYAACNKTCGPVLCCYQENILRMVL